MQEKIPVGISQCVLGENVRFDGGHKRSRYCTDELSKIFDFKPICPEVGIGMGVPRPTIRLVENEEKKVDAQVTKTGENVTTKLESYADDMLKQYHNLRGYIFCQRSPSCGVFRIKVYDQKGKPVERKSQGIYARRWQESRSIMPIEEDGRLNDSILRENFITRVFTYDNWLKMEEAKGENRDLINFHSRHKFLCLAHSQTIYRQLGRIVANANKVGLQHAKSEYIALLMRGLSIPATRKNHVNVLMHIQGFFKQQLSKSEKKELNNCIHKYRLGYIPLLAPISMLINYLHLYPNAYLEKQVYFNPYPEFLKLRYSM